MKKTMLFLFCIITTLSFMSAFKSPEAPAKPDLQVVYPDPRFIKESGSVTVYEFTLKNIGTQTADLRNLQIRTAAGATWINADGTETNYRMREVASEKYKNMHYDLPPNPERLEPGQSVVVRAKVDCRFPLPQRGIDNGMYTLEVFVDSKNTIDELREDNNRITQNSVGLN